MAKKETRTLSLVLIDPKGKTVSYSIRNPKPDLDKEAVDNAVKAVIDGKIFATANGDLMALKSSQVVTRQVETLEYLGRPECPGFSFRARFVRKENHHDRTCTPLAVSGPAPQMAG